MRTERLREIVESLPRVQRMLVESLVVSDEPPEIEDVAQEAGISPEGARDELGRALKTVAEEARRHGLLGPEGQACSRDGHARSRSIFDRLR